MPSQGGSDGGASAQLSALAVFCSVPSAPVASKKAQGQTCRSPCQPLFLLRWCLKVAGGWAAAGLGDTCRRAARSQVCYPPG